MDIIERNDAKYVLINNPTDMDGGLAYLLGHDGITEIRVVKRKGPLDWLPYIEVYRGDHLFAEMPQHNTLCIEFADPMAAEKEAARCKAMGIHNHVNGQCTTCDRPEADCDCLPF